MDKEDDQTLSWTSVADLTDDASSEEKGMANDDHTWTSYEAADSNNLMDNDFHSMHESASDNELANEVASVDKESEEICKNH
jgi:hypothetical protein